MPPRTAGGRTEGNGFVNAPLRRVDATDFQWGLGPALRSLESHPLRLGAPGTTLRWGRRPLDSLRALALSGCSFARVGFCPTPCGRAVLSDCLLSAAFLVWHFVAPG